MKGAWTALLVLCCEHSGLGFKVELDSGSKQRAHPLSLPPVPAMQNAGTDGLPELPTVQAMAGSFLSAESNAGADTKTFIGKLQKIGKSEVEKLQHLKSAYDQKLKYQEKGNQQIVKSNAGLAKETIVQNRVIDRLMAQIKHFDQQIKTRRQQMHVLEQRFADGRKFMKDALTSADDVKEMSLLGVDKSSISHDSFLELDSDTQKQGEPREEEETRAAKDSEGGAESPVSFLEHDSEQRIHHNQPADYKRDTSDQDTIIAEGADLAAAPEEEATVPAVAPQTAKAEVAKGAGDSTEDEDESMIKMMKDSLHRLRDGSRKSEEAMKAKFQEDFKAGAARKKALLAQQSLLQTTLKALKAKSSSLQQAAATLKARLASIEKKLQRGGALVGSLSKVASARIDEVPEALKDFAPAPSAGVHQPAAAQVDSGDETGTASSDSA